MCEIHLDASVIGNAHVMEMIEDWVQETNKDCEGEFFEDACWGAGDLLHFPPERAQQLSAGICSVIDEEQEVIRQIALQDTLIESGDGSLDFQKSEQLRADNVATRHQHEAAVAGLSDIVRKIEESVDCTH